MNNIPLENIAEQPPILAVVGPTGAGKSALALRLAALFHGEIVNCDSVQVYRGLDIGSAKTAETERLGIPHHLLDIVDPDGELTAGEYARRADVVVRAIQERDALPIITGGTGFYLKALLYGLPPAKGRDEELRARLGTIRERRPGVLHRFLRIYDKAAADRIHPNDHQKLIRAIELVGQPVLPPKALAGFRVLKIGLLPDRTALYERLNRRSQYMFESGLLAETQALLDAGISPEAKAFGTLGYRQAIAVLRHGMPVEDAIADCQLRTRHYAKRQVTWFRAEPEIRWLAGFGDDLNIQEKAVELVREFLG